LIAYAQLRLTPTAPHGDVELARFYVDQAHHGRGIAQALMAAVDAHARARGGTRLWLGVWEHNARAIAFYRKCGFEKVGEHPFVLGTDLQRDWDMARPL
jgi:diamine N-acetyltransferase